MPFARFMATFWGRAIRIIAGLLLIWWGVSMGSIIGWIIALIGLVALLGGLLNVCPISPLLGAPFRGKDIPSATPSQQPAQPSVPEQTPPMQ